MRRHYKPRSSAARDAAAERRLAQAEADGVPARVDEDFRTDCFIDLRGAGGPLLVLQPRRGYVAWRVVENGKVIDCAAIKTALHRIGDRMVRMRAPRSAARD